MSNEGARIRYIGLAEESTYGTKITDDDGFIYSDGASVGLDAPAGQALIYEGITQRAPVVKAPGPYAPSGDLGMPLDARVIGFLLKWALGSLYQQEQLEGSPEVYRHTFLPANTLDSFTARLGKDLFSHDFQGCKINEIEIDIPKDNFATVKVNIVAQKDTKTTVKEMSAITIQRVAYFYFSQAAITINEVTANIEKLNIKISNGFSGEDGTRLSSRFPQFLEAGDRKIEISCDATFDATTHLTNFWGNATTPTAVDTYAFTLTLTGPTISGATSTYTLIIDSPAVIYQDSAQTYSGRERIVQSLKLVPIYDETTGREIRARLTTDYEPYSLNTNLHGVYAQSTSNVWVVGTRGEVQKSADGGTTFAAQTSGIDGLDARLNAIFMQSATVGWMVGDNGKIYVTANGGTTWTAQTSGVTTDLMGVWAYDANTVYVVGKSATILYTANGGTTWTAQTAPESVTGTLNGVFGKDASTVVAVGASGKIIYTANAGTLWSAKTSGKTTDLLGVTEFTNVTDLWLVCGASGVILTSTDADTWSSQTSGTSVHLRACDLASLTVGMAVGETGVVIKTSNGGTTWSTLVISGSITSAPITTCWGVSLASTTVGWVVGSNEAVWKTTDGSAFTAQTLA